MSEMGAVLATSGVGEGVTVGVATTVAVVAGAASPGCGDEHPARERVATTAAAATEKWARDMRALSE
jgi:hypothetical protein